MLLDEGRGQKTLEPTLFAHELFGDLINGDLRQFEAIKRRRSFDEDEAVFNEGEKPRFICITPHSTAVSSRDMGPHQFHDRTVEPGQIFGMIEALADGNLETSLKVTSPCELEMIDREDLMNFLLEHPEVCLKLVQVISGRYQRIIKALK